MKTQFQMNLHFRITTVPFKVLSAQDMNKLSIILCWKLIFFNIGFSLKASRAFSTSETIGEIVRSKQFSSWKKRQYLQHFLSENCLKGNVVNRTCHTWNYKYSPFNRSWFRSFKRSALLLNNFKINNCAPDSSRKWLAD